MLVTVNNRLKFEIEIVRDLSCHPIHFTGHVDILATAVADDVVGFTIGQTLRLRVILRRLAVSVRARYPYLLYSSITLQYYIALNRQH